MLRALLSVSVPALLAGCISFSSTESAEAPDYRGFCQDKETQCRQTCSEAGIQAFSCRAGPSEGLDYKCECKKPLGKSI